jgi:hypothetical protein
MTTSNFKDNETSLIHQTLDIKISKQMTFQMRFFLSRQDLAWLILPTVTALMVMKMPKSRFFTLRCLCFSASKNNSQRDVNITKHKRNYCSNFLLHALWNPWIQNICKISKILIHVHTCKFQIIPSIFKLYMEMLLVKIPKDTRQKWSVFLW